MEDVLLIMNKNIQRMLNNVINASKTLIGMFGIVSKLDFISVTFLSHATYIQHREGENGSLSMLKQNIKYFMFTWLSCNLAIALQCKRQVLLKEFLLYRFAPRVHTPTFYFLNM